MRHRRHSDRGRGAAGFTLIEVILAVGIAVGLLVVALQFYHQAADLRTQLLLESERVAAIRLVMDRIGSDLRCAFPTPPTGSGISGDSTSLEIVKTELPPRSSWAGGRLGRTEAPVTDLRLVRYGVGSNLEETNVVVSGLVRTETPVVETRRAVLESRRTDSVAPESASAPVRRPEPITDAIRFIRFRYWDGAGWVDTWTTHRLPQAVEIELGTEPLPAELLPADYPYDVFRRVVVVPSGIANPSSGLSTALIEPESPPEAAP